MTLPDSNAQLLIIIRKWAEVFVKRSIREFKHFMDESGLSPSQINTLMRLNYSGACGVSEIGEHIGVTNAAASQLVDRLVNQGFVVREEDPQDRRAKHLSLTQKGKVLVEQGITARQKWMEQLTSTLTPEEQETIASALMALTDAALRMEEKEQA